MAWGLPFVLPQAMPNTPLASAILQGLKSGQQLTTRDIANQAARTNLASLADLNKARLNALNLANQSKQLQTSYYPKIQDSILALRNAQIDRLKNPLLGLMPTGLVGQEAYVNQLANKMGSANPYVQQLSKDLELIKKGLGSQINSRTVMAQTAPTRTLTTQGKKLQEESNIRNYGNPLGMLGRIIGNALNGNAPVSGNQQQTSVTSSPNGEQIKTQVEQTIPSNDKKNILDQYEMSRIKSSTDADARARLRMADAAERTISQINPQAAAKYAGAGSSLSKAMNKMLTPLGWESHAYDEWVKNKKKIELLTTQIRNFYHDSVQPEPTKALNTLLDYDVWSSNPKLWLDNYNNMITIFHNDKKAYEQGLRPQMYKNKSNYNISNKSIKNNDRLGIL